MPDAPIIQLSPRATLALWLLALPLLLAGLGTPVVQRTQEARVLETAREMFDSPDADRWLIPRCNGAVRLNKPPLEYWLPALCFKALGVTEFAGRLPFALAGWLTLAIVYRFGRALVDPTFGLLSAAILLSSYMFFRHSRLAETDGLAAFFLTAGVYWLWRGGVEPRRGRSFAYFHLAAASLGLVVLSKGPPAAFALLFFIAWALVERKRDAGKRALLSGAGLTGLIVGGAWYFTIRHSPQFRVLWDEVGVVTRGKGHGSGSLLMYVPAILTATAPWTGVFVLGTVCAIRRWRAEPASRVLLLWAAAVLLPLCLIGNKQVHYLVSMVAPLAMLTAYGAHRGLIALDTPAGDCRAFRLIFRITLALSALAPLAIYLVARQERGLLMSVDFLVALMLIAGVGAAWAIGCRHGLGPSVIAYAAAVAVAFAAVLGRWIPTLRTESHRTVAETTRASFGDLGGAYGPRAAYAFFGPTTNVSLPLVWNLRAVMRVCETEQELLGVLRDDPRTIVVTQAKNKVAPPPVPAILHQRFEFNVGATDDRATFRVYSTMP